MADEWYYAKRGDRMGPVGTVELQELAGAGQLLPDDLVWKEGMTGWTAAREVGELFFSFPGGSSPSPLPFPGEVAPSAVTAGSPSAAAWPIRQTVTFGQSSWSSLEHQEERPPPPRPRLANALAIVVIVAIVSVGAYFVGQGLLLLGDTSQKLGPQSFHLGVGEDREFYVEFPEGKEAHIWVTSREDSDVDIFVYDANGRLIVEDTRFDRDCYVTWVPPRMQTYKIVVANRILIGNGAQRRNRPNFCTMKYFPE